MNRETYRKMRRVFREHGDSDAMLPRGRRHDPLAARASEAARVAAKAEDGRVAIVQSGMDCDCVQYSGVVTVVPACIMAVEAWLERENRSADGPFGYAIERPSVAAKLQRKSRDLIAEAFEDGHSHVVYA